MRAYARCVGRDRNLEIEELIEVLLDEPEEQLDALLEAAGATDITPPGWSGRSRFEKRMALARLLRTQHHDVVDLLQLVLLKEKDQAADEPGAAVPTLTGRVSAVPRALVTPGRLAAPERGADALSEDGPIFVVHGRDHAALHHVVRVLERSTGREVVVLHEQPNGGRTLLEKFEDHAATASYAVVLLTADDQGGLAGAATQAPRGRQNVVFELGFFFGKLGRGRVAVLLHKGVERPSDLDGLVYISLEDGSWKHDLLRELQDADIHVDYSRLP